MWGRTPTGRPPGIPPKAAVVLATSRCPNCGKQLLKDYRYCPFCGKQLKNTGEAPKES